MEKIFSRGDVVYAKFDGVGSEQQGVRPAVIVSNNINNKNAKTVVVLPITSKLTKHNIPTHYIIKTDFLPKTSIVLGEQIRTIDKTRINDTIGHFNIEQMKHVDKIIKIQMGL